MKSQITITVTQNDQQLQLAPIQLLQKACFRQQLLVLIALFVSYPAISASDSKAGGQSWS